MPVAPRRRRPPDDLPAGQRWTDRVPAGPPAADDRFPPHDGPLAAPPPPDPWAAPPPRSRPEPPAEPTGPRRGRSRRLRRRAVRVLLAAFVLQALVLVSLRWVDPPTTAFMLADEQGAVQQSVPVEHVSRWFLAAVIAHEDQALPYRDGAFTWDELSGRAEAHLRGEEDPSGSTIPQQVAKNLFLTPSMSVWRKAVEAGLAAELSLVLDDRRVLELYVNSAQLGPHVYGICAASWYWFDTPPSTLSADEAVQLVGLLPSPGHVQRAPGGGLDFDVADGLGWLSRSHVLNAQARVPRHLAERGFQPVEDAGVEGLAQDQPDTDDDCSERPEEVAELIAAEGTG
ncbi:monofunctional biosynthetic peptidoglycan transglycosylase [Geodermatophilus telluris]|uniref:Monofunctional biosynthetic peptidoglycan transglycosylase n=1 Tax=Geodermatophilus telluris TaxID=1190417 RepID=A0A1G6TQ11_9ACTN|nr:transglycosylase domain-containing protein [Geodermatophilus telluris]SDD30415.1 monofunctional biosynthetic peptidoglycan transglycosylase [Geodermatophilus telluris]